MLLQEKQRNVQLERASREQVAELEAATAKAEDAAREKEQQIKILYDEAAQKDKENQSTRSLILQKNTMLKQQTASIEQLGAENRRLQQQQAEHLRAEQLLQQQLQEQVLAASAAAAGGAQQAQGQASSQLQMRAEALATENSQLRHEAANYAGLLQEMQANFDMMTQLYEAKLLQAEEELAAARAAPAPAPEAEATATDATDATAATGGEEGERDSGGVGAFEKELLALLEVRERQRRHTWVVPEGSALSVEYMQEERIHQLLEEIGQMDVLLAKAPALVHAARQALAGHTVAALEARLEEEARAARDARQESELLLHAIESGDLQPYADLKMRQQAEAAARAELRLQQEREAQRAQEEASSQPAVLQEAEGEASDQQPQQKRKGWFSWLG